MRILAKEFSLTSKTPMIDLLPLHWIQTLMKEYRLLPTKHSNWRQILVTQLLLILAPVTFSAPAPLIISPLDWMDNTYMTDQRARVDQLTRNKLGTPIRGNKADLLTLQRVIDGGLIKANDKQTLQALGVILGDVFLITEPLLEWKVYEDKAGRSRALCVKQTEDCLFPITMLSRRMKFKLVPNVNKVFLEALDLLKPHLPEPPYGAIREYTVD